MASKPYSPMRWGRILVIPERRVYIRSERGNRYFSLSPASQVAGLLIVAILFAWTGLATTAYVGRAFDGNSADARLETMRQAYEARIAALTARQGALEQQVAEADSHRDAVTAGFSEKQAQLVDSTATLKGARVEVAALRERVSTLTNARRDDAARIASLDGKVSKLQLALANERTERANLDTTFDRFSSAMERVIAERDTASAKANHLEQKVAELTGNLGNLKDRQRRLIDRISNAAQTTFDGLESLFSRSNIDVKRILAEARRDYSGSENGSGGPFVPLDQGTKDAAAGNTKVAALMKELETVNLMRYAANRLPFADPVKGARLTSGFGPREDPFGRGRSMHEGIDLADKRDTPIHATAAGIVTFVGRESGYGNVVKIKHAFGFETVYAHLHRALVKVGQRVARGDRIGEMGDTGRSTGTHLHYEVRIDDKPVNPLKFIEAARDVL